MIKIGEFSKIVQVPVPTLRYYDQIGLLKPVEVDMFSGYRYYTISQVPQVHHIIVLKGLGFSLEQIASVLAEGIQPEQMRGMLRLRHAQISRQLADMHEQLREVEARIQYIERENSLPAYNVVVKNVEPLLVASVRAVLPAHAAVGTLFGEVYQAIRPYAGDALWPNPEYGGQTLVLWYDTEFKQHDVDGAAAFMLRRAIPEQGRVTVGQLPAVQVAAAVHHGSYETIGAAHEALLQWIDANGYLVAGPDRELNLYHDPALRRDDATYITEIQYPIVKENRSDENHAANH